MLMLFTVKPSNVLIQYIFMYKLNLFLVDGYLIHGVYLVVHK